MPKGDGAVEPSTTVAAPAQPERRAGAAGLGVDHVLGVARVGLAVGLVGEWR